MNGAQRAAFNRLIKYGRQMANMLYNLSQRPSIGQDNWTELRPAMHEIQEQWDAAKNRFYELENQAREAREAKSSARKSRGAIARKRGVQS